MWNVKKDRQGKILNIKRKAPWPFVNHYYCHIMDPNWGHITIRMSGHPPFAAQMIVIGHEYVACQAKAKKAKPIEFTKEGNCFTHTSSIAGLRKVSGILRSPNAVELLTKIHSPGCFLLKSHGQTRRPRSSRTRLLLTLVRCE